jgi:predicted metal-binding membrane protein
VIRSVALPRPVAATIVVVLLACASGAWLVTGFQVASMGMGGMAMIGAGLFLLTWLVMMVAMMAPSVAPMVLAYAAVTRSRHEGNIPTATFVLGYLLVWTLAGLIPLAAIQTAGRVMVAPPWVPRLGGLVIVLAGIYQFTPLKNACLRACRSPMGFLMTHDWGAGLPGALRAGASHGLWCLGCCWALMAVLGVLGLMNLAWMAVIAAVFFVEKNVRYGDVLPKVVGAACIAGGLALAVL